MELKNEFSVSVPVDEAWAVLTDVERIAPCMPGAQLQEVDGDEYRGMVRIKVGPITAQYRGNARFVELDKDNHRAVLRAEGRDTRGQGNASATVVAELEASGQSTHVTISTDLSVTGKVAQFGRGVLADVSAKLLGQFVERLEADVLSGDGGGSARSGESVPAEAPEAPAPASAPASGPAPASGSAPAPGTTADSPNGAERKSTPRLIDSAPAEPVDLLDMAGGSVAKRLVPAGAGLLVLLIVWRIVRGRRRSRDKRAR